MCLLKVTLSTLILDDMPKLVEGLKKLNKADPSVEIYTQESGDIVLSTCGEVHLQRCIRDLDDTFAKVKIRISEPLVSFKETIMSTDMTEDKVKINASGTGSDKTKTFDKLIIDKVEKKEKKDNTAQIEEETLMNIMIEEEVATYKIESEAERLKKAKKKLTDAKPKEKDIIPKSLIVRNMGKVQLKTGKINTTNVKKKSNVYEAYTPNQKILIKIRAVGLNFAVAEWLEKKINKIRRLFGDYGKKEHFPEAVEEFKNELNQKLKENEVDPVLIELIISNLVCFGPRRCGPNLLINKFLLLFLCFLNFLLGILIQKTAYLAQ